MKPFHIEPGMKTLGGVFYPTGYMVLMFPGEQAAREAARKITDAGLAGDTLALITPADVERELAGATGDDDILPSAGTEGDTIRRFRSLAKEGHHGLMVHAPSKDEAERVMEALRGSPITYGQRYRKLVIEDIEA